MLVNQQIKRFNHERGEAVAAVGCNNGITKDCKMRLMWEKLYNILKRKVIDTLYKKQIGCCV